MPKKKSTLDTEIFAVGKWNGMPFDESHLKQIENNFDKLKAVLKVPLKFGHNDDQPLTDGQPAIGWVSKVWYEKATQKLMATFINLPEIVYRAIKSKLYAKVSIEIDRGVVYKDKELGDVLTAVALLGADLPAVSTIGDLDQYMTRLDGNFIAGEHLAFTAISNEKEETIMATDDVTKQIAALMKRADESDTKLEALKTENATLKAGKAEFERKDKAREEADAANAVKMARDSVEKILEDAVTDKKILPAQREQFTKLLHVEDDASVLAVDLDQLKAMIGSSSASFSTGDKSQNQSNDDSDLPVDEQVSIAANKIIASGGAKDFSRAMTMALQADPKLAAAYRDNNDQA